jgi:transposase
MRHQLALELVDDVARLDKQIKESHRRIRTAVRASKTSLTDLFGVGPVLACSLIGYSGDIHCFANRDSFAAYAGIAPVEHSSGGRVFHRLSLRGHRRLNNAMGDLPDPPAPLRRSGLLRSQGRRGQDQA